MADDRRTSGADRPDGANSNRSQGGQRNRAGGARPYNGGGDRPSRDTDRGNAPRGEQRGSYGNRDDRPRGDGGYAKRDNDQRGGYGSREGRPTTRDDRPRREGGYQKRDGEQRGGFGDRDNRQSNRDDRPRREGGYQKRDGEQRGGFGNRDDRPRREGGYQKRDGEQRGGFGNRDNRQSNRDERPRREGGYQKRDGEQRGGFGNRDDRPRREGGYQKRDGEQRGGFGNRDDRPRREGAYQKRENDGGRGPARGGKAPWKGDKPAGARPRRDDGGHRDDRRSGGAERSDRPNRDQSSFNPKRGDLRSSNRADRPRSPEIDDDVTGKELDRAARAELRYLEDPNGTWVAKHLVMAGRLVDLEPELAYEHALAASRRGGRIAVVREAVGLTAYAAGQFADALREFRTFRRISGSNVHLPMMADCERGLGRPEKALELARSEDAANLDTPLKVEMAIVASGAQADLGNHQAALAELEIPQLDINRAYSFSPRLFTVYAEALEELGRHGEAEKWYARVAIAERALGLGDYADPEIMDLGEDEEDEPKPRVKDILPSDAQNADAQNADDQGAGDSETGEGNAGEENIAAAGADEEQPAEPEDEQGVDEEDGLQVVDASDETAEEAVQHEAVAGSDESSDKSE
ncbi:hypothetical protein GCM10022377_00010 [Zhihengliuella alba]|uniref:Tetratricopeptide repeat protein n=1 Tax=Zhihengliuella alba TaxID=547018 RepID=A0ABP7CK03_9MICC